MMYISFYYIRSKKSPDISAGVFSSYCCVVVSVVAAGCCVAAIC